MKQCRMDTPVEPEYDKEAVEYDGDVVNCHSALNAESRKTTNSLLLDTGIKYQYDKNELYRYDIFPCHSTAKGARPENPLRQVVCGSSSRIIKHKKYNFHLIFLKK